VADGHAVSLPSVTHHLFKVGPVGRTPSTAHTNVASFFYQSYYMLASSPFDSSDFHKSASAEQPAV
jgi:hypothetical protein